MTTSTRQSGSSAAPDFQARSCRQAKTITGFFCDLPRQISWSPPNNVTNDFWEIESNGIHWKLEAVDKGADTPDGTAWWRVTHTYTFPVDNYANYSYHNDGRIKNIAYGGNRDTNDEHLVEINFEYASNAATRTDARAGFVTTYEKHITKITIGAYDASDSDEEDDSGSFFSLGSRLSDASSGLVSGTISASSYWYAYDLVCEEEDSMDFLTSLEREGKSKSDVETIASFEYSEFNASADPERESTDIVLESLGATSSSSDRSSKVTKMLIDFNRDGLPDVVDSSNASSSSQWEVGNQAVDHDARSFSWDGPWAIASSPTDGPLEFVINKKSAYNSSYTTGSSPAYPSYTAREFVDMDGDGYLDLVESGDEDEWEVHYGNGNGFDYPEVENAPCGWTYSQKSWALNADASDAESFGIDVEKTLIDLNGDGWLDAYEPEDRSVCYHKGERGEGWGEIQKLDDEFEAIRSVKYTLASEIFEIDFSSYYESSCEESCEEAVDEAISGCQSECGDDSCDDACGDINDDATRDDCYDACSEASATACESVCEDGDSACGEECFVSEECYGNCETNCEGGGAEQWTGWDDCLFTCYEDEGDDCEGTCEEDCVSDCETNCEEYCFDPCGDGDYSEMMSRSTAITECTSDCVSEAQKGEEKPERQKYVSATDETKAFYDLNGDGLPDYVDASALPWQVYLNNGREFQRPKDWDSKALYIRRSNEGRPEITWESSDTGISETESGSDAEVYQALLDVDSDGLLDLAFGNDSKIESELQHKWYKNTGSGFEDEARSLPAWWPDAFMTSSSTSDVDGDTGDSSAIGTTESLVMDLDHDGILDAVSTSIVNYKVSYGTFPKPYVLTSVKNGQGGGSSVAYRSSATTSPSGDFSKTHYMPITRHLVDIIKSEDENTGKHAKTSFEYEDGYYADGVFQGFKSRVVEETVGGTALSKVGYAYELDRDFSPLVTTKKIFTDQNLGFAPNLKRGDATWNLRYQVENTYDDKGPYADNVFHLLKSRKTTEYGEFSGSEEMTQSFVWDNYGNMTSYSHDGGGDADDLVVVSMTYVGNNEDELDATFWRMKGKFVSGKNPITGTQDILASETYYYDAHTDDDQVLDLGLLTRTETAAGWLGGSETLSSKTLAIAYERGDRGELESVTDEATGISIDQTFDFGGAVLATQTNALGQKLEKTIDEQGRVSSVKDDNGLTITFDYDAFNRVIKKIVIDVNGKEYPYKDTSYSRSTAPYYTTTTWYDDAGAIERSDHALEDGFGNVAKTWVQDQDGDYLVSTEIFDLRGLPIETSHPHDVGASFTVPTEAWSISNTFSKTYYDAFGAPREMVRDAAVKTGSQLISQNSPRVEIHKDERGYQTKLTYDAHHRLSQVEQGKSDIFVTTGKYGYDALDRLVRFEDGGGMVYTYSYDGANRLREAKYKTSTTSSDFTSWYRYTYKGSLLKRQVDSTGAYASWEYDGAGRVTKIKISDGLPSSTGTLSYTYDYDDNWAGALYKSTDPSGNTVYDYDEFGRVESAKRTYATGSVLATPVSATFTYDYDLQGRLLSKTLPSGRVITSDYDHGYLATQKAATGTTTDYTLTYDYNDWGLPKSIESSTGHLFGQTYTTPLWPDAVSMKYNATTYKSSYGWHGNSLLKSKTASKSTTIGTNTSLTFNTFAYSYDALKQFTKTVSKGATIESFTYDNAGNLTKMQDSSGATWKYAPVTTLNQIKKRTSNTGPSESYTYDKAGRMKTFKASSGATKAFYYDGLGRLRGIQKNGSWEAVFDYDPDGNLVRRADNNPFTATAYYTYSFKDWRYDEKTATTTEFDNGFVAVEGGTRQWLFKDYDGHPMMTFDDSGTNKSERTLGAYGASISSTGTPWTWNAHHGAEDKYDLYHMGQRHLMQKDGQWLQPEPLLYKGIPQELLGDPLKVATYRYARNAPTGYRDDTGNTVLAAVAIPAAEAAGGATVAPLAAPVVATAWYQYETMKQWPADMATFTRSIGTVYDTWDSSSTEQRVNNLWQLAQNQVSTWTPMVAEPVLNAKVIDYDPDADVDEDTGGKSRVAPGEGLRGGSKKDRDQWFGLQNKPGFEEFKDWWHHEGKEAHGGGDLTKDKAKEVWEEWSGGAGQK